MRRRQLNIVAASTVVALFSSMSLTALAGGGGRTRLEARLSPTGADPLASGKAKFEMRDDRIRLSVEVEDVSTATTVRVEIDGIWVGTEAIVLGSADLNLDSRDGDSVSVFSAGDSVKVFDAVTGTMILSGTLAPK